MQENDKPLLLTALLNSESQIFFERQRNRHYPAALNIVPAHLMLFHNLPRSEEKAIGETLQDVCRRTRNFTAAVTGLQMLGRGVAYRIEALQLIQLHRDLAEKWKGWLIPQDRQKFHPHIVIQNKVTAEAAHDLYDKLQRTFIPFSAGITGLTLWFYHDGPWTKHSDYAFLAEV